MRAPLLFALLSASLAQAKDETPRGGQHDRRSPMTDSGRYGRTAGESIASRENQSAVWKWGCFARTPGRTQQL